MVLGPLETVSLGLECLQGPIHRIEVEGVGVERPAGHALDPGLRLLVFIVVGIPKALELLVVSPDAAGVLWGTGPLAAEARASLGISRVEPHFLHQNLVAPGVAQVVLIRALRRRLLSPRLEECSGPTAVGG